MPRGDGIARVKDAPLVDADGEDLPDGTRPEDLRGASWPWIILGCSIVVGLTFGSLVIGAAWLEVNGRPVEAWLRVAGGAIGSVLFAGLAALVTKVANGVGKTRRSQAQLSANQYATSERVDNMAAAVKDLIAELRRQDRRIDDAVAERAAKTESELRGLQEQVRAHGARIGRTQVQVATITGPQPAVPAADSAAAPAALQPLASEPDPEWPRGGRPPVDATGPLPTFDELWRQRSGLYRPRSERRDPPP